MSDVKVKEIMTRAVITVEPDDTLQEAAKRLACHGISGAPVVKDGEVVGMISESDIIAALSPSPSRDRKLSILDFLTLTHRPRSKRPTRALTVGNAMTRGVIEISPESSIWKAAAVIEHHRVKRLPVTDEKGALVGIVSRADLVRAMARGDESIRAHVLHAIETRGQAASRIQVAVDHGVVTLSGVAQDGDTRLAIRELATHVPGVASVNDEIAVQFGDAGLKVDLRPEDLDVLDPWVPRGPTTVSANTGPIP
jgi:CBS domain-containing protein